MCHSQKNGSQSEKSVTVRKLNAVSEMCHSEKNVSQSEKNGSQLEKYVTVRKLSHSQKNGS